MKQSDRPDIGKILDTLKDFQRASVDYIFDQLIHKQKTNRFLLADEVGLGKTLVARGVVARLVDYLWDRKSKINITYICSNANIARQNINRLNISKEADFQHATRLSLMPRHIHSIGQHRLNFIALTPGTSFDLKSTMGVVEERAMLYWLLHLAWPELTRGVAPMNVLEGWADRDRFRNRIQNSSPDDYIDPSMQEGLVEKLLREEEKKRDDGKAGFRQEFEDLYWAFRRMPPQKVPVEFHRRRNKLVGELRGLVAGFSVETLQPDLVILDEFQRFKDLLDEKTETGFLANKLFDSNDVHVLLLSATPYKMYTLNQEDEDNHYLDFIKTLGFLFNNKKQTQRLRELLDEYRRELYRVETGNHDHFLQIKEELERVLKRVMARTERLTASEDRDGMLKPAVQAPVFIQENDVRAYVQMQGIANLLDRGSVIEYWKSAPYLLNFMENYELKRTFRTRIEKPEFEAGLRKRLKNGNELLISWDQMSKYEPIDPANPRVRQLINELLDNDSWKMLWLAPSMPYYQLQGPFGNKDSHTMTKRLIFSSWVVVPRSLSVLISYEVERRMMRLDEKDDLEYTSYIARRPLLRFSRSKERLTGMPLLAMIYPSFVLAEIGDPLYYFRQSRREIEHGHEITSTHTKNPGDTTSTATLPDLDFILRSVRDSIAVMLDGITKRYATIDSESEREDEAWYWAAPILLDAMIDPDMAKSWWDLEDLALGWSGKETEKWSESEKNKDADAEKSSSADDSDKSIDAGWADHVDLAIKLYLGQLSLGKPPSDLADILAKMAVSGPANCALRTLKRVTGVDGNQRSPEIRLHAGRIAWSFRTLFNIPASINLIRGLNRTEPYWERVLDYCADGCIQSVMDEYGHILRESLGLIDTDAERTAKEIADAISKTIGLHTATPQIDLIRVDDDKIIMEPQRLRSRYAMRFGDEKNEETGTKFRSDDVRNAFNSPFQPFVLITTSMGQEGLDFHQYCHAVVHWNLPSNPVDLEQREGRVHRFKGHAVRRNIAEKYANKLVLNGWEDPWKQMFRMASDEPDRTSDLMPFWIYPNGSFFIQRHVPTLPMSQEISRLVALRQSLAIYRMVFGQPRQEDLLDHLRRQLSEEQIKDLIEKVRIDLAP